MYIPRIIKKEEIEKMSNYELIKLRRQLMSSLRKADEDKIKMQRFMELHPDTLTK